MQKKTLIIILFLVLSLSILPLIAGCKASPTPTPKPTPAPTVTTTATATITAPPTTVTATPAPAPTVTATVTTSPSPSPAQAVVLKVLRGLPWTSPSNLAFKAFWDRVIDRAGGRLVLKDIGGSEVYPTADQLKILKLGTVDMLATAMGYIGRDFPEGVAMVYTFGATPPQIWDAGLVKMFDDILLKEHGLRLLGIPYYDTGHIWLAKKTISSVADLKAMKIRVSEDWYPLVNELATAVTIPFGDIYTAMERGVVDGMAFPSGALMAYGLEEVTKYRVDPPFWSGGAMGTFINAKSFNALPADLQQLLKDVAKEVDGESAKIIGKARDDETKILGKLGITSVKVSDQDWVETQRVAWEKAVIPTVKKVSPTHADEVIKALSTFYPPKQPYPVRPWK
ncbi:MAG: TRAP transporter substrate-binding protein DctP [Chloroflexi bacterium]|nr:TRAP transporter substrate-binding protein DctP [Chloroflexota bacterium]